MVSPNLVNYATDWIMSNMATGYPGVQPSPSVHIIDLELADNVVFLGDSPAPRQAILDRSTLHAAKVALEVNTNRMKAFLAFIISGAQQLSINGERIENVPSFKYLGSSLP